MKEMIIPMIPEITMLCLALFALILDLIVKKKEVLALIALVTVGVVGYLLTGSSGEALSGMFISDGYSLFFKLIFLINLTLTILLSIRYLILKGTNYGEYYSLMLFSTLGMMIMASAGDLIVLYLGLELMALSTYILAGFRRNDIRSNEAALKYFLLGAFASAFLLYGISLTYGLTGTTNLKAIAQYLINNNIGANPALILSMLLLIVAMGFKIAAAPFHMWAPDVYEGAPTPVTAFMSVGPKAAGFAILGRVLTTAFGGLTIEWSSVIIPIAVLTMAVGNILAIAQSNIKRMLAYSSIAHAGYALIGIIAGNGNGIASMMNYLFIYAFMNIGAFAIVTIIKSEGVAGEELSDYEGLAKTHPMASALMLIFMFSLTGIPPTAGFIGKFYLFMSAVKAGYTSLAIVAVIFSAISAYFYLRVVMYMYMKEPKATVTLSPSLTSGLAIAITALAVLIIGLFPTNIIELASLSVLR